MTITEEVDEVIFDEDDMFHFFGRIYPSFILAYRLAVPAASCCFI